MEGVLTMKMFKSKLLITAALAMALGACASKPDPIIEDPIIETPTPAPTPTPTPTPTATPTPVETYTGPTPGSMEEFRMKVGERIYFDTDMFNVDNYDTQTLDRQAAWLKLYPDVRVTVAGNCDERGTREYNIALGARRANAVKEYLVAKGVPAYRIDTISYGKEKPIDPRSNEEGWAITRNAFTMIMSGANS